MYAAGGAVLIAGVGVWAVFKLAFWVAQGTGRSLNGEGTKAKIDDTTASDASISTQNSEKSPKIASPLEELAVNANLRRWRERQSGGGLASELAYFCPVR